MRYFRLIAVIVVIIAALLVFPNRIPEFAGIWLVWCAIRHSRETLTRFELLVIPVWLLIKFPEPVISLFAFVIAICAVACWFPTDGLKRTICAVLIGSTWLAWIFQHHAGTHRSESSSQVNGPIVCLGDSLTDFGYPDELRKLVSNPIEDFGFNGYTSEDGIKLIPQIVELKPAKVILELGGHDFRKGCLRSETAANMRTMIESFRDCGAEVILVEIPHGFINDPWYGFERQLAREYDLDLIPDSMIRTLVYWSPVVPPGNLVPKSWRLSEDAIHPNENGNRMMARTIAKYLD